MKEDSLQALVTRINIYLFVRRTARVIEIGMFPCIIIFYVLYHGTIEMNTFLTCCQSAFLFLILFELSNIIYKYILYESIDKEKRSCLSEYTFQEKQCKEAKELFELFISQEHYKILNEEEKMAIEKEKSGNGDLALKYLRVKVQYSIAHMWLRKLKIFKNVIKKWW